MKSKIFQNLIILRVQFKCKQKSIKTLNCSVNCNQLIPCNYFDCHSIAIELRVNNLHTTPKDDF